MQSTIKLFWYLYNHLPPLFPEEAALEMKNELLNLENHPGATLPDIENKMIEFGYAIWPWNQAYKYFLTVAEERFGDHFLLPQMSDGLREKYLSFKEFGGTLKDLRTGGPASFFTSEERVELCGELVQTRLQLRSYLDRDLVGINRKQYLNKVEEYENLIEKIKANLNFLRVLARAEEDHPALADEINSKIRDFEYSLCSLGAELDYEAVCQAKDFFVGRKVELSRLRGINIPMQIDFFNS